MTDLTPHQRFARSIPGLVLVYWGVAAVWIVVTDSVIARSDTDSSETWFNIAKGIGFVTVTAALLSLLLRRRQRALDAARAHSDELQTRLEDSQRMDAVGRLAGGVAHDFNNLLAVIQGHLELARLDAPPELADDLDTIEEAVSRAVALTGELQTVARRQRLEIELVDLADEIRHHRATLETMLPDSIEIAVDGVDGPVPVKIDRARFQQVIINLSTNARDAMPNGGRLVFTVTSLGGLGALTVTDSGVGMTAEELRHCFEPFYTTKPKGRGTGLGLSLAYGVIHQSGGTIRVLSTPGKGTTVEITLPLAQSDPVAELQPGGDSLA